MGFGIGNTSGAWLVKAKKQIAEVLARIGSVEKTLSGSEKIPGTSAPTAQVAAKVGQIYINVTTGEEWKCVAVNSSGSVWEKQTKSSVGLTAEDVGALPITGGTMLGDVTFSEGKVIKFIGSDSAYGIPKPNFTLSPTTTGVETKDGTVFDSSRSYALALHGGGLNLKDGHIYVDSHKIQYMAEPTEPSDAATKGYVDGTVAGKQDKLTGTAGQIVGFDKDGRAVAQAAPATGVTSFKGRSGAVTPQSGDYTAAQVGAKASDWKPFHTGPSAPTDDTQLWIDTDPDTGGLKYWNGSKWTGVPANYS